MHICTYIHTYHKVQTFVSYVCMHECMYVCMHECMYVCMHECMHVRMYVCMYVCTYVRMYVRMYVCTYACMYVCMHACMHACIKLSSVAIANLPQKYVALYRVLADSRMYVCTYYYNGHSHT